MVSMKKTLVAAAIAMGTLASPAMAELFRVYNQTGQSITGVWFTSERVDVWDAERLRGNVVRNGQYYQANITNPLGCIYDLRVQYGSGQMEEWYGINICGSGSYTIR
ncbi:hypothetical protein [Wenxinia saemankumensis]|uniref:Uncharacterized protein n=1 Tax=Wenxinia saemankumensis TaxID=1447782 RepID=A0A1M6FWS1_9RHOB|nr:hypothetical protein [Wenxinia saemankumensis]SHJ02050.1 hypothetical protein SAMN05444417_2541 [Wenxinia saemankumensis]